MTDNQAPAVTISQLHIRYQHHWLFDQFNFHLPANRWTCLLGPSGIGKTSILRFLAGLSHDRDTEYSGHVITSDNLPLVGRLSYITQQDSLLPWLSVIDNVLFGLHLRREKITKQIRQKAYELLEKVGLTYVDKMKPEQLSVGMKQCVALVRTLIENRQIILLDEPFSALDIVTKIKLQDLAATLLAQRTVLLVTHDPLEALRLGDGIYVLAGRPAKINHIIEPLPGKSPRNYSDIDLLAEQAKLLQLLAQDNPEWRY